MENTLHTEVRAKTRRFGKIKQQLFGKALQLTYVYVF